LRIRGLEISTTEKEAAEVTKIGGCEITDIKTGKIRVTLNEVRSLWIQCPILVAKMIAEKGSIRIGWTQAKVDMLQARPLQCFRCLEQRHVQQNCKNNVDRRSNCYRCGEQGHLARDCESKARCQICTDAGVSAG
ncbi:Gag polyprotein, partial [Harpegnathos saltator]